MLAILVTGVLLTGSTFDVSTVWIMAKVGLGDGRIFRTAEGIQFQPHCLA